MSDARDVLLLSGLVRPTTSLKDARCLGRADDAVLSIGRAHLIGVCGSGMKSLAEMLLDAGWAVSGSDNSPATSGVQALEVRGLQFFAGHAAGQVPTESCLVVHSAAIPATNVERLAAKGAGQPDLAYHEVLARLMQSRTGVAIAGTHGKSTTTAMCGTILQDCGVAGLVVGGGELVGSHRSGMWQATGDTMVVEACEYRSHFLGLSPRIAVITSVEGDHFDCFPTRESLLTAFAAFAEKIPSDGILIVGGGCAGAREAVARASAKVETFGLTDDCDWFAGSVRSTGFGQRSMIYYRGTFFTELDLPIPGVHNLLNALAATAAAFHAGAESETIRESLAEFEGIHRRFERVGSWGGTTLIDDYAHHPTAVEMTLSTAREIFPGRRIVCAFQPHQLSRTRTLLDEFASALSLADVVHLAPVFTAREGESLEAVELAAELARRTTPKRGPAIPAQTLDQLAVNVEHGSRPGDVRIAMGAGNIDRIHHEFTRRVWRHSAAGRTAGGLHLDETGGAGSVFPHSA